MSRSRGCKSVDCAPNSIAASTKVASGGLNRNPMSWPGTRYYNQGQRRRKPSNLSDHGHLARRRSCAKRSARKTLSSDWYGTSRRFASTFRSSIMATGSRMEIVRSVGFRVGNLVRLPLDQSTYSVESCVAQNSRSSSSVQNLGIVFFITFVGIKLFAVHVSCRDHPNEIPSDCKGEKQESL